MTTKEEEKVKTRRVETAKLCYNLCHSTITITILGNAAPIFGIGKTTTEASIWLLITGLFTALIFFCIGYTYLKK